MTIATTTPWQSSFLGGWPLAVNCRLAEAFHVGELSSLNLRDTEMVYGADEMLLRSVSPFIPWLKSDRRIVQFK